MSDEIKEILEDVKRHLDYVEATKQSSIRDNEMKAMYDYITNLQEKNEKLKKLCDIYEEEHNNEFKIWKDERHQLLDYKSRCEKAIEYGNNCLENLEEYDEYVCESIDIVSLLRMIHHNYIDKLKELKEGNK